MIRKLSLVGVPAVLLFVAACSGSPTKNSDSSSSPAAGNSSPAASTAPSTPKERIAYTVWVEGTESDASLALAFKKLGDKFNLDLKMVYTPLTDLPTKINLAASTGDFPDIIFKIPNGIDTKKMGVQGILLPLKELSKKYAPNFLKALNETTDAEKVITVQNDFYQMPVLAEKGMANNNRNGTIYRKDILDKNGIKSPTTTEEFYNVLKQLKQLYPDSAPISNRTPGLAKSTFFSVFGVYSTPVEQYILASDAYKESIAYMAKLYKEKLLDNEFLTITQQQFNEKVYANKVFFFYDNEQTYEQMGTQLAGINTQELTQAMADSDPKKKEDLSKKLLSVVDVMPNIQAPGREFSKGSPDLVNLRGVVFSKKIKNPERALEMVDYLFSKEGSRFGALGDEGVAYTIGSDGKLRVRNMTDEEKKKNPLAAALQLGSRRTLEVYRDTRLVGYRETTVNGASFKERPMEIYEMNDEQTQRYAVLNAQITKKQQEYESKFITGALEVEKGWNDYINDLKKLGLDEMLKLQNDTRVK
ncbi:extracellular solute-binding protein [Paenibacillus koleovorans]|uniref:extracellular solute-binding protein n=1 Tax=Paenibacillus koleovorans TaxID=121608 RepID=UPI0013E353D1|nr:extracellular solute-binding protein [Paenibacillus koleovorans]